MLSPQDITSMRDTRAQVWQEKKKGWTETFSIYCTPVKFSAALPSQPVAPDAQLLLQNILGEKKPIPKSDQNSGSTFGVMGQAKHTLKLLQEDTEGVLIQIGYQVICEQTNVLYRVEDAQKFEFYWVLYLSEVV